MEFSAKFKNAFGLISLTPVFLWAFIACSEQKDILIDAVDIISVQLALSDSLETSLGVELHWEVSEKDSSRLSYFDIYYRLEESGTSEILIKKVSAQRRSLILNFPSLDSSWSQIYFGVEGVYEEFTGQEWRSRDIVYQKIGLLPKVNMLSPAQGSYSNSLKSIFQVQSAHDRGVHYDFYAFLYVNGKREYIQKQNFPFNSTDASIYYRTDEAKDSLQFPFPSDTVMVKWCIKSTEVPNNNPVNRYQTLSCSYFYRLKPE